MSKIIMKASFILQLIISTSMALLGNERGEIIEPVVTQPVEPVVEPKVEPVVEPTLNKNDLMRDLSKELGINLFDVNGLKQFKEYTESQKTEQQKLQEQLVAYENEKAQWQSEKLEFTAKLKASELGIKADALEDALKLAGGDPNKLADVIKKYPVFKSTDSVRIGVQDPNNFQAPTGGTEAEQYIKQNYSDKKYEKYIKK